MPKTRRHYPKGTWMKLRSADILLAYMDEKDFSIGQLARYAGCSRAFISHLRAGRKTSCTPQLAERIAEALDAPRVALFVENPPTVSSRSSTSQEPAA